MPDRECAIAFDFDGTLIQNGPLNLDKGVHILFASWYACRRTALSAFLEEGPEPLLDRMIAAYIRYPGAPRFEQFSAIVNALVNHRPDSVKAFNQLGLDEAYRDPYQQARDHYNRVYSGLNDAAAEHFWKPYPSVKTVLERLAGDYDLYIASGVTQEILETDFARHGFDASRFSGIWGGDATGGNDKARILTSIRQKGYRDVLFVADSNRDLEYAEAAGTRFFRIRSDADYRRLDAILPGPFPDERTPWGFEPVELDFFREKAMRLIAGWQDAESPPYPDMSRLINT